MWMHLLQCFHSFKKLIRWPSCHHMKTVFSRHNSTGHNSTDIQRCQILSHYETLINVLISSLTFFLLVVFQIGKWLGCLRPISSVNWYLWQVDCSRTVWQRVIDWCILWALKCIMYHDKVQLLSFNSATYIKVVGMRWYTHHMKGQSMNVYINMEVKDFWLWDCNSLVGSLCVYIKESEGVVLKVNCDYKSSCVNVIECIGVILIWHTDPHWLWSSMFSYRSI